MSTPSRENALDHVVVVMFENRSFDNLLGRLYEPGEVASFEGVLGKDLSNPVPEWAEHRPDDGIVRYGVAPNMNTPNPDPGEELPHINTQLFGILDEENRGVDSRSAPSTSRVTARRPTMDGFVTDYISMLTVELGRQPTVEEYAQIMTGYTPEQMPVLSGIARGFATFDHWFCDVPTCTYPNRSFFHAGQSSGYVVNMSPPGSFPKTNDAETLFDRLDAAGLTWKVYCDPPSHYSLTGVIHAPRLAGKFATNFFSTRQFFEDAEKGELPTYSFIEPQIIGWNHNDMHPPFAGMLGLLAEKVGAPDAAGMTFDPPSSLIAGEDLLARIYDAIRDPPRRPAPTTSTPRCWSRSTSMAAPTTTSRRPPRSRPTATASRARWASRSTALASASRRWRSPHGSPSAPSSTDEHRATSLLATMRERWNLGAPITAREASARSFTDIFTLSTPRAQEDWPEIIARPVPEMHESLVPLDAPLSLLGKSLLFAVFAMAEGFGQPVPDLEPEDPITGAEAIALAHEMLGELFPAMRD